MNVHSIIILHLINFARQKNPCAVLVTKCKYATSIDFPPHLMGKQCVQYKNGFRNFSYRRETTKPVAKATWMQ